MKKNDIFKQISDEDAAKIAAEYPTGDKKQRDRVFGKVEKRVNGSFTAGDEVSGVDIYRPRIAMKIASAAAVAVLVAGGAGAGYHIFRNNGSTTVESSLASKVSEASTEVKTTSSAAAVTTTTIPSEVTEEVLKKEAEAKKEALLEKIRGVDYEQYDRINMKYRTNSNDISFIECAIKRDGRTGNESQIKKWTHSPEYYKGIDSDDLGATPEELAETYSKDEMYFAKDMFICVYTGSDREDSEMYEIVDRSNIPFDDPTIFSDTYSETLIRYSIGDFEIKDITENTSFLGRECTDVFMECNASEKPDDKSAPKDKTEPENAPVTEPEMAGSDIKTDQKLSLTIDNETGIILKAKLNMGDHYFEEYEVEELLFNDDAELPENGEYIRNRIAKCAPINDSASYDLSVLD